MEAAIFRRADEPPPQFVMN